MEAKVEKGEKILLKVSTYFWLYFSWVYIREDLFFHFFFLNDDLYIQTQCIREDK